MVKTRADFQERVNLIRRGQHLQYFTIGWNSLEGLAAITAGLIAGSISLVGFGFDSLIEVTSGSAALWRVLSDDNEINRERVERLSLKIVGICFLALAAYIGYGAIISLVQHRIPEKSIFGIIVAITSLITMPLLAHSKRRIGTAIGSAAVTADARQTEFCVYLSAILLLGLLHNALFGLWWADAVAAFIMVPLIAKEGVDAVLGKTCIYC